MSLSGNLDVFPLEEVLRLLARSRQSGCLRVEGAGAGRVYLEGGSISYAAVEPDDSLRSVLIGSGLVSEESLAQLDLSKGTLSEALTPEASASSLSDVIREQCVESLYRIRKPGSGPFSFTVDTRPRYATGQSYDIEMLVSEADRRASEWADIEQLVPDLDSEWRMKPTIDEESVKLSDVAWRFLAALEGQSSVETVSGRLGLTSFQAGRRMAELARARLVEPVPTGVAEEAPAALYETPASTTPEPVAAQPTEPTPWTQPQAGYDFESEPTPAVSPEPAQEEVAAERPWWQDQATGVEESTSEEPGTQDEAFLEDVFGRLEESNPSSDDDDTDGDDEDGGGFGLLRRRGLGAAFRELADS